MPALNTSSLPDLIFTLLFFFMIVTTMREVTLKVQFTLPQGTELEKLEKKSLVTFIYVGEPTQEYRAKMGTESRIQLNDSYAEVGEVQDFIFQERASMSEGDAAKMTVSLKVDQKTKMGIVTDVKNALRKSYALKINWPPDKTWRTGVSGRSRPSRYRIQTERFLTSRVRDRLKTNRLPASGNTGQWQR